MTTKAKSVKPTTHTDNKAIKLSVSEVRAIEIGKLIQQGSSITASINTLCIQEHKARKGKEVGTAKSGDAFMVRLKDTLVAEGYAKDGDNKLSKVLSEVRKAINTGSVFSLNSASDAKRKGAKTAKSSEAKPKITIKIEGSPKVEDVAKAIREAVNSDAFRDHYADLAAFLVDALDEFEGA